MSIHELESIAKTLMARYTLLSIFDSVIDYMNEDIDKDVTILVNNGMNQFNEPVIVLESISLPGKPVDENGKPLTLEIGEVILDRHLNVDGDLAEKVGVLDFDGYSYRIDYGQLRDWVYSFRRGFNARTDMYNTLTVNFPS